MGPLGIGVGFHRLFSHRQFETYKPIEYTLALLGTLSAYAPVLFWASQHIFHHSHSDKDNDPSTPKLGFWESFLFWRLRESTLTKIHVKNYPALRIMRDPVLMFLSKHFQYIVLLYATLLLILGPTYFISMFILPAFIEHARINAISSLSHMKLPLSYRNFDTSDDSYNNIVIGILSFGFGWHNNHHHNQRELINSHRWYEVDLEGLFARLISKPK
jgi:stearoyl-CoA desaturase (delta-9 desaturase)